MLANSGSWYRGNTHTHTAAPPVSDVSTDARTAVGWYRDHGYDFVVVTDHEHLTDVEPLNDTDGFLVLPGQEITQMIMDPGHPHGIRHGHVNGIGTSRVVLPLGHPDPDATHSLAAAFERNLAAVRAVGGIPQVNHPNLHWSVAESDLAGLPGPYLLEIWNAFWAAGNLGGVDDAGDTALSTEELWDRLLSSGTVAWAVASDDTHDYESFADRDAPTPGKGWIVVRAPELTRDAVLAAIRAGSFYASTGLRLADYHADGDRIRLSLGERDGWSGAVFPVLTRYRTRFTGRGGIVLADVPGSTPEYRFRGDEGYVRATVTDAEGRRLWTQPVFLAG